MYLADGTRHKKGFIYQKKPHSSFDLLGDARALRESDDAGIDSPYKSACGPQRIEVRGKMTWKPFDFNNLRPSGVQSSFGLSIVLA